MGAAKTHRYVLNSLINFLELRKVRNEPIYERDYGSVLIFLEHRRSILMHKYEIAVENAD